MGPAMRPITDSAMIFRGTTKSIDFVRIIRGYLIALAIKLEHVFFYEKGLLAPLHLVRSH